jgi:hypothetical protein
MSACARQRRSLRLQSPRHTWNCTRGTLVCVFLKTFLQCL